MTAKRWRVLVTDKIDRDGLRPLAEDARFELLERGSLKPAELAEALDGVEALLVRSATRVPREALARAKRLRIIGRAGVGVDTIDLDAATEKGVAVVNAPGGNTIAVAELTFALLLALVRKIPAADRSMRAGGWDRSRLGGTEIHGKLLGLVGAGRVGAEVARRARAFGMSVVAHDPFLAAERARELEIELVPLDDLLRRSDVVSLHTPLTDQTRGLVGARELGLMRPDAILINAARGGVVDEVALLEALQAGRLGGAALDVYAVEPLPADHPFRSLENVILTPHLGASTEEAQRNVALEVAEAVRAALVDGDLSRAVNGPAIGGERLRRARPLLDLATRLGRLLASLAGGAATRLELRYSGAEDLVLDPLAAAAAVGFLESVVGRDGVNLVNSLHLARTRGIEMARTRSRRQDAWPELLELRSCWAGGVSSASGVVLGGGHTRIIELDGFRVDVRPSGTLLILRNRDVPGVIGRVGTALGQAGLNIGEYHQARHEQGGEALATVSTDGSPSPELLEALRTLPEVLDARVARLD
ncbi:MAG TPA: phosphoglycerate dehydrogenase [Gemmatimonadales bacterium]|nr:phosphoglycerate dehydrogenase [Gemmatimonadales bacterium]